MVQGPYLETDSWKASHKFLAFMEPESSLPYSKQPTTGSYPETHVSSPYPYTIFSLYDPF